MNLKEKEEKQRKQKELKKELELKKINLEKRIMSHLAIDKIKEDVQKKASEFKVGEFAQDSINLIELEHRFKSQKNRARRKKDILHFERAIGAPQKAQLILFEKSGRGASHAKGLRLLLQSQLRRTMRRFEGVPDPRIRHLRRLPEKILRKGH